MKKIMITILGIVIISGVVLSMNLEHLKFDAQTHKYDVNKSNYNIEENEIWKLALDEEGNEILESNKGGTIRHASEFNELGEVISVPLSRYLDIINNNTINSQNIMESISDKVLENPEDKQIKKSKTPNEVWKYCYKETSISNRYGSAVKVTADVAGGANGATISYGYNEVIGATYGGQASL